MAERGAYAKQVRPILRAVQLGGSCAIALSPGRAERDREYRAINAIAGGLYGVGNYHLRLSRVYPLRLVITRAMELGTSAITLEMRAAQDALIDWMSP